MAESTGAGIIIAIAGSRVLYAQRIESYASGHGESASFWEVDQTRPSSEDDNHGWDPFLGGQLNPLSKTHHPPIPSHPIPIAIPNAAKKLLRAPAS
jgi:hypothetical protein